MNCPVTICTQYQVARLNGYPLCAETIARYLTADECTTLRQEEGHFFDCPPRAVLEMQRSLTEELSVVCKTLKSNPVKERNIFNPLEAPGVAASGSGLGASTGGALSAAAPVRTALSKLVEYPGDFNSIRRLLESPLSVDPAGKDMFGLAAVHKFSSWNKTELLELLLPHLTKVELNAPGECKSALWPQLETK